MCKLNSHGREYPLNYGIDCCCPHITSHNEVRGHKTGFSHSGAEEYPREKHKTNQRWYNLRSLQTQFMPPPETHKSEIASELAMCQVHTGAYVPLLAPEKTGYTACHPRKTTTYILHVIPINTHTHDRLKSIGKKKQRKERKIKERKEKTRRRKNEKGNKRKEKTRKARKDKTRRGSKERNREKNVILAYLRN